MLRSAEYWSNIYRIAQAVAAVFGLGWEASWWASRLGWQAHAHGRAQAPQAATGTGTGTGTHPQAQAPARGGASGGRGRGGPESSGPGPRPAAAPLPGRSAGVEGGRAGRSATGALAAPSDKVSSEASPIDDETSGHTPNIDDSGPAAGGALPLRGKKYLVHCAGEQVRVACTSRSVYSTHPPPIS